MVPPVISLGRVEPYLDFNWMPRRYQATTSHLYTALSAVYTKATMETTGAEWEDAVIVGRGDVLECNEANIIPQEQAAIARIRTWLRPTRYAEGGSEYHRHLSSHLQGTGDWVLASPAYKQWHDSDQHGFLWVRGDTFSP